MRRTILFLSLVILTSPVVSMSISDTGAPVRMGVIGLVHGHVGWILDREDYGDIEIVGIVEPDRELAIRMSARFGFDMELIYESVEDMLDAVHPEAITVFTNIFDHLAVTKAAALMGVHVMVEKPLAISLDHAKQMKAAADSAEIHLLTNYETTWYDVIPYVEESLDSIGELRKMFMRFGHPGPIEIGVGEEFSSWLLTEEKNGGGAITDFGCYGANLMTWFLGGQRPLSVTAVTQIFKHDPPYGEVDDEATIILTYPSAQGIIKASWNWSFNRKDMDFYGTGGFIYTSDSNSGRIRNSDKESEDFILNYERVISDTDPFAFFAGVVRGEIDPKGSLSSLSINMVAMEILDAAIRSAKSGSTILLPQ